MTNIVIVDDHEMVRNGLVRLVESAEGLNVMAEAGSGREAVALCSKHQPDVALVDFTLPDMDGLQVIRLIADASPRTKVIVVTMHDNEEYAARALENGAKGYIIKGAATGELISSIYKVAAGSVHVSQSVMEKMLVKKYNPESVTSPISALSVREYQIFALFARGRKMNEIADELSLSSSTVNTYKKRIYEKLEIKNSADLVRLAIKYGVITPD